MSAVWAGDFDCSQCRRKRLTAAEFSKNQLAKKRKDNSVPLKCKACTSEEADAVVALSTTLSSSTLSTSSSVDTTTVHPCSACLQSLPAASFNKNQLYKGVEKQRCVACVTASIQAEANIVAGRQKERLSDLREKAAVAEKTGNAVDKVKAAAEECAAEAEMVTGLKPIKIGKGRGRGSWRGRGRGTFSVWSPLNPPFAMMTWVTRVYSFWVELFP